MSNPEALLADRYLIERELGRGGMATVYLARDQHYGRHVALKILRPELAAALGPARFLREIEITSRLSHPHILPLYDSGVISPGGPYSGPYYAMPYVSGETLRTRLQREQQLPVDAALQITIEVADALDYAHGLGIVHRDIKPENILLSGGHALVADFGLARALEAAGEETLTATGLAIGTLCYMSPEQAGSSRRLDGRSDIYSLGCVLFEMLAGEPPFTGPTAQAIVARHAADPVPPLRSVRPAVPPAVEHAMTKALAKVPADRWPTAREFAEALESGARAGTPRLGIRNRRVMGPLLGGVAVAVAGGYMLLSALGGGPVRLPGVAPLLRQRERVLIADFDVSSPSGAGPNDTTLANVATDAFRIDLAQSTTVTVVSPAQVAEALARMRLPPTTRITPSVARELAEREGFKAVVVGEVGAAGGQHVLFASLVAASSGDVLVAHRETARDSTAIVDAVDRLSKTIRSRIGESLTTIRKDPPLSQATTSSLEALRNYSQAGRAIDREGNAPKALGLYEEAIALDSNFAAAYLGLTNLLYNAYDSRLDRAAWALTKAFELRDRLSTRERHLATTAYYGRVRFDSDKAIAAHRAMLDIYPDDAGILIALGRDYFEAGQYASAESVYHRALALDSSSYRAYIDLAETQALRGNLAEGRATFGRMVAAFPDNAEVEWWRGNLASMSGEYEKAVAHMERFRERSGHSLYSRKWASSMLGSIAAIHGRMGEAERHVRDAMAAALEEGDHGSYYGFAAELAIYDIRVLRQPRRALRELERALATFPLDSLPPLARPYLSLAKTFVLAGQPGRARELIAEYERTVAPDFRRMTEQVSTRHAVRGELALGEGQVERAIEEFRLSVTTVRQCPLCGLEALARAYATAGQTDSAIAVYERYLGTLWLQRVMDDGSQLALVHRELGRLYEQRGERTRAKRLYARFLDLWKDCDPELHPAVAEVRRRVRELEASESR